MTYAFAALAYLMTALAVFQALRRASLWRLGAAAPVDLGRRG